MALDSTGSTRAVVAHRRLQANKAWHRVVPALCNKRVPWRERLQHFYTRVASSLFWGAGLRSPGN
eukprot:11219518-Lingulodinium_polyedra.AAC.1